MICHKWRPNYIKIHEIYEIRLGRDEENSKTRKTIP